MIKEKQSKIDQELEESKKRVGVSIVPDNLKTKLRTFIPTKNIAKLCYSSDLNLLPQNSNSVVNNNINININATFHVKDKEQLNNMEHFDSIIKDLDFDEIFNNIEHSPITAENKDNFYENKKEQNDIDIESNENILNNKNEPNENHEDNINIDVDELNQTNNLGKKNFNKNIGNQFENEKTLSNSFKFNNISNHELEIFNILKEYKNKNGDEDLKQMFNNLIEPKKEVVNQVETKPAKSEFKPLYGERNNLECPICLGPAV